MGDDDRRVETAVSLAGTGASATPERIASLQRRQAQLERLHDPEAGKRFAEVLAQRVGAASSGTPQTSASAQSQVAAPQGKRGRALPRRGPRPGLVHPGLREVYGRDEEGEDIVVLKG